jgi:DNA-binding transcriptional LysR family regulator
VSHVQTGQWVCVLPERLAELFAINGTLRAIPIVGPEAVHRVGLVCCRTVTRSGR